MDEYIEVEIPSKSKYIKLVRKTFKNFLEMLGYNDQDSIFFMELAINEAIANVIEHTYKYKEDEKIIIKFILGKEKLRIEIRDFGKKVDPSKIKPRDLDKPDDHGLGIHIIRQVFGDLRWEDVEKGNLLILEKNLNER